MTHKRSQLHRMEERLKHILRDQVAEFASLLEVIISVLVLTGLVISSVPVARSRSRRTTPRRTRPGDGLGVRVW